MRMPAYFLRRYRSVLRRETDIITRTRIRILFISLLGFILLSCLLCILYIFKERNFLLARISVMLVLFSTALGLLLYRRPWQAIGHFFIICLSLLIWSNMLFFHNGVNIVTVQYCLFVVSGGYYILGLRAGTIYSLINILPLMVMIVIDHNLNININTRAYVINNAAFTLTATFNFLLLGFTHYFFFKALKKAHNKERQLRANLQKAVTEARELAVAKTNFLTTMSHELRTPLNAVVGVANILLTENSLPGQRKYLDILQFSAENLMATINDILDFNRIDDDKIKLTSEVFKPAKLITSIAGIFNIAAKEKQLQFDCIIDPVLTPLHVSGDHMRLTQILFHLVSNAVKFTEKGFVKMEAAVVGLTDEDVVICFTVTDSGIGIPEDKLAKIFEPFTGQLSRTSRQFHSTLGLTIAYRLVKLHNSELLVNSTEGKGSEFAFQLAYLLAAPAEQLTTQAPAKNIVSLKGLRVLVVEDEKLNVLIIKKILEKWGIMPCIAVNGKEAVEMVAAKPYDIILMDINMPVMDGFEASRQIRNMADPTRCSIPIIAVTASIGAAIEQISQYPFIDDCLLKPFKPENLKEKIELALAGNGADL